jgi:hypothetical protein
LQVKAKNLLVTALLGIAWVATVAAGVRFLLNYETSPGLVGAVSGTWPAISELRHADDRPTLVMLAHPQCPCTRASMGELAQIMAHVQGKVRAYVLFYTPKSPSRTGGTGPDWENTELRRSTTQIPGVTVLSDIDGVEARRFGAETSGHTFLFDASGRLLFNGGITGSRGHAGDNTGENAIVSLVNNHTSGRTQTFVFGCALADHKQTEAGLKCLK